MKFKSIVDKLGTTLGLTFCLTSFQLIAFAETRLFVPSFHIGGGFDTQLLITNNSIRDAKVDLWVFLNQGKLLGQEQLLMKAHETRSLTLADVFGSETESKGWLAAVSDDDGLQMSYNLLGERTESHDAEAWPQRKVTLDIPSETEKIIRLVNTSSVENSVTVRLKDETGGFLGLRELTIGAFGQLELTREVLQYATHLDVVAVSEVLAVVGESANTNRSLRRTAKAESQGDDGTLSLVINKNAPLGAYQVLIRFDPATVQFFQDDISGGLAPGFTSKPLAVSIDNVSGELRIASFQIGNAPQGNIDAAHIRVPAIEPSIMQFGLKVEEITDLQGHSELNSIESVSLVRLK